MAAKEEKIKIFTESVDIRKISESPLNANQMKESDFNRLVKSIKKDGVLTSAVTLMQEADDKYICISGHHRIKAAKIAGLNKVPAIITPLLSESTRIRIQLQHNDIHGNNDEGILSILQRDLNETDLLLVDYKGQIDNIEKEFNHEPVIFEYVNICLKPISKKEFMDMIEYLGGDDNLLIEKEQYEEMRELLTLAFKQGFKTPGRAFRKFLDIIQEHKEEI